MTSLFLIFIIGLQFFLIGFNVIKINWKNVEIKKNYEKRFKIIGLIFIFLASYLVFGIY